MRDYVIGKQMTGDDFRRIRDILGMTQREFAAFAGCSPRTVENWETKDTPVTGPVVTLLELLFRWPELAGKLELPPRRLKLRLWYMYKNTVCTVIDADEMSRRVEIRNHDEIGDLSHDIRTMQESIVTNTKNLARMTAERERVATELALAAQIQADALPNVFPAFPEHKEFDIFASMTPAKAVGGDFYDFFLIDETHLGIVMADVSGKDVPAALFMMSAKSLLRTYAMTGLRPAQVLHEVNNRLCENNRQKMFVTIWFGVLDFSTGHVTSVNAGHEYPALNPSGKHFDLFREKSGFLVGAMKGLRYRELEFDLTPGARIFLYTDGIPEASDAGRNMFGEKRMIDALNEAPDVPPEELLANVRKAVDDFVKEAPQFDDLTMLCLDYKGPAVS